MHDEDLFGYLQKKCKNKDTSGFNFFDFLHIQGSPLDALFYSRLFWPKFIEINGMVFLKETVEDDDKGRLYETLQYYNGDKTETEKSYNLIEVPSLFGKNLDETSDDEDFILANRLAEMWYQRLQTVFPDRNFTVKILSAEETGGEVGVIFYTERD